MQPNSIVTGRFDCQDARIALVAAKFNSPVVDNLLAGALARLEQQKIAEGGLTLVRVPGAMELPLIAQQLLQVQALDAVIALGAVIRGETSHFDYVCSACERGLQQVSLQTGVPVIFGVLTTENAAQAFARADVQGINKGGQFVLDALEMISLIRQLN